LGWREQCGLSIGVLLHLQDAVGIMVVVVFCASIQTKPPHVHAVTVTTSIACVYVSTPVQLATTKTKNPAKHANYVDQVLTTMKSADRRVKIAQLANTTMKWENRLVEIVQLGKIQEKVHRIVDQIVAMQKLIIQHTKKIVIR
jgi:hypothetical protein